MMTRLASTLALGAALLCAPAALAAPPERTPALLEKGKASYARNCVACHGPKGEGDGVAAKALKPKPRNLVTEPLQGGAAAVFEVLGHGVKGTGMIAYKHLSEEERWAIAYHVAGLGGGAAR
jgi:mono/diheme cytochrome c family protein